MHWILRIEGGPRRVNHAAVSIDDFVYSFGGYCSGENFEVRKPIDVHVFNTGTLKWRQMPVEDSKEVPYMRYGHIAVSVGHKAYIWGGRNDADGACNQVYCYNAHKNTWKRLEVKGEVPAARDGHTACVLNKKIYFFGGYEELTDTFPQSVCTFDTETLTWAKLQTEGRPPKWRDFHTATAMGPYMYIFGGRSSLTQGPLHLPGYEIYKKDLHILDICTNTWHQLECQGDVPCGRRSHSAFAYKNCLYIFGGYNFLEDKHYGEIYRYHPPTGHWVEVKPRGAFRPCARRRQCACIVNNSRVVLFGGTSPSSTNPVLPDETDEITLSDHSDLYMLDLEPSLKTLGMLSVIEHQLDTSGLPQEVRLEINALRPDNNGASPWASTYQG